MGKLFDMLPMMDPISKRLPKPLSTIANPGGPLLKRAVGAQTAAKLIDPMDLSKISAKRRRSDMASLLDISPEEMDEIDNPGGAL